MIQVFKTKYYIHRYSLTKRTVCVAWKQIRGIISVFVLGPSVLLNAINVCMFLEDVSGCDPSYERNVVV